MTILLTAGDQERIIILRENLDELYDWAEETPSACDALGEVIHDVEWMVDRLLTAWSVAGEFQEELYRRAG